MPLLLSRSIRRLEPLILSAESQLSMSRSRRWRKNSAARKQTRAVSFKTSMEGNTEMTKADYKAWSHEQLIERVAQLEAELKKKNSIITAPPPATPPKSYKKPRNERPFDPSKYSTRLVAFKLAYLGKRYNGFEHSPGHKTPLPTIEEELWKAFNRARLIFPKDGTNPVNPGEVNFEGCEYTKCGRTDKGVSAFGQVIGIRVRSNRPLGKRKAVAEEGTQVDNVIDELLLPTSKENVSTEDQFNTLPSEHSAEMRSPALGLANSDPEITPGPKLELETEDQDYEDDLNFDPIQDEIPYISLLNRLLPPDIKILAWCPSTPLDFSARFSCRERQYRYYFTQPAFVPTPHNVEFPPNSNPKFKGMMGEKMKDGWLNIEAMREAAKLFEGEHDFRNFCKIDPGKQISNFERRVFYAGIEEVDDTSPALSFLNSPDLLPLNSSLGKDHPKIYTFTLHGSAFLWHQVRCMVAILFLVGQGLEKPSLVKELLDVKNNPRRPTYEMATDTPLVLWDCVFPQEGDPERKEAMGWVYAGDTPGSADVKYGTMGVMDDLWKVWRERKVDELLAGRLLAVVAGQGKEMKELSLTREKASRSQKVFGGDDGPRLQGTYTPVMKKQLMESAEVVNEKYAKKKGFESSEDMKMQMRGFRRVKEDVEGSDEASIALENGDEKIAISS